MDALQHKARFDWLAEIGGASALAGASGYAAMKVAPPLGMLSGLAAFGLGYVLMRTVKPAPRAHPLPAFKVPPFEFTELLLDTPWEPELLLEDLYVEADGALLLDEPLPSVRPDSRVVQLFASPAMPTPGELKQRIDRHLAGAPGAPAPSAPAQRDASRALYAALEELKRSLR